jgi:hypothetical protein
MGQYNDDYLRCLETLDVAGVRALWARTGASQPKTDREALASLHYARTCSTRVHTNKRAYSHSWLRGEGLPTGLPDNLKAKAERLYPVVKGVAGISVISKHPQIVTEVRGAMEDVVENAYADGNEDPAYIRPRMMEARKKAIKRLF